MSPEIDEALEAEVARRATTPGGRAVAEDRSRVARLACRLYAGAGALHRRQMLACLLRPLGTLAIVGVASGAFAGLLDRVGERVSGLSIEELGRFTNEQIFELARFVEQVSPEALHNFASSVADNPLGLSTLTASAALLMMNALRGGPRGRPLD